MSATYAPSTVKRARTILARATEAELRNRRQQRAPIVKADWRKRPASDAQIARIHRLEKVLGYRLSPKATIGNAGAASDLYKSLKAELA